MDISSVHFADWWIWAHFVYWPILLWALFKAPWKILREKESSNILFATCAGIFLLWHLRVSIETGLNLHLIGATVLTLMFRWQTAVIANALIVGGITLTSQADFAAYPINALLTGVLPIAFSYLMWRINEWYLPANYFVYIFFASFLSAGLSILMVGFASYELLKLSNNLLPIETLDQYFFLYIPMMYPEAFLTGAIMSIFVIYKPQWISTFDDRRYLYRK